MLLLLFASPADVAPPEPPSDIPFWYGVEFGALAGAFVYGDLDSYEFTASLGADGFDYMLAAKQPGRQDVAVQRVASHLQMLRRARLTRR